MSTLPLTVTVITLNEERNLPRLLRSLEGFAREVIVVDSGSTDQTQSIAERAGARWATHAWSGYGQQKNYAQSLAQNDWVFSIDADEELTDALKLEIRARFESGTIDEHTAYSLPRLSWYLGRWIRHGGWYPNRLTRLSRRDHSRWTEPQVHEQLETNGSTGELASDLLHYPFADIREQVETNLRYSREGSEKLRAQGRTASLLKLIIKPIGKFLETYVIKLGCLDGMAGFIISVNAAHSIFLKYAYLFEDREN